MLRAFPLALLFLAACSSPVAEPATSAASAPPSLAAAALAPGAAERSPAVAEDEVIRVNNTICAVSRSRMAPQTLGRYVSRVAYRGNDPRFRDAVFEFNQCCGGCVDKFPSMWAERPDEILRYHGVDLEALAAARAAVSAQE